MNIVDIYFEALLAYKFNNRIAPTCVFLGHDTYLKIAKNAYSLGYYMKSYPTHTELDGLKVIKVNKDEFLGFGAGCSNTLEGLK